MRKNLDNGVLHAMRAFACVVDAGSFSLAADQLRITTAQVSRLVTELEKRLQTKLLHRSTRQRTLTDAGAAYLARCREVLDLVAEAEAEANGTLFSPRGRLRVQCMTNFGQHYISPLLPEFFHLYPHIQLEYSTSQYAPDVLAKGTDVTLYLATQLPDSGLTARKLATTFCVLSASPAYLARHGTPQDLEDLHQHACLQLINPSISPRWKLESIDGRQEEATPHVPFVADSPDILLSAAEAGMGIALLPLFTVIDAVRAGRLRHVLPQWRSPEIGLFALLPSRQFVEGKTRAWLSFVDERVAPAVREETAFFDGNARMNADS